MAIQSSNLLEGYERKARRLVPGSEAGTSRGLGGESPTALLLSAGTPKPHRSIPICRKTRWPRSSSAMLMGKVHVIEHARAPHLMADFSRDDFGG